MAKSSSGTPNDPSSGSGDWRSRAQSLSPGENPRENPRDTPSAKPAAAPKANTASSPDQATPRPADAETAPAAQPTGPSPGPQPEANAWVPLDAASAFAQSSQPSAGEHSDLESSDRDSSDRDSSDRGSSDRGSEDKELTRRSRKGFSWFEWSAIGVVAAVLIGAVAMHYRSKAKVARLQQKQAEKKNASTPPPVSTSSPEPAGSSDSATETAVPIESVDTLPSEEKQDIPDAAERVLRDAGDGSFSLDDSPDIAPPDPSNLLPPPGSSDSPTQDDRVLRERLERWKTPARPGTIRTVSRKPLDPPETRSADQGQNPEISIPLRMESHLLFKRLYADAFETYQTYAKEKKNDASSAATGELLGQSIALFEQCLLRPHEEVPQKQRHEISLTLARLYREANRPYESGAYALYVATFAPTDSAITRSAATLAFASFQLAHEIGYGSSEDVGNLRQMVSVCDLIRRRKIAHPQQDTLRYSVAQLLQQQGMHDAAAIQYTHVGKQSPLYKQSMLAAGRAFAAEAKWRIKNDIDQQKEEILHCAVRYLSQGIELMDADSEVTASLLAGKLTLAEIYLSNQSAEPAVDLVAGADGVIPQKQANPDIELSDAFVTTAHELLFRAQSQLGDLEGVQATLATLSKRYGPEGKTKIASLYRGLTRDFLTELASRPNVTAQDTQTLQSILASALDPSVKPAPEIKLWAAGIWIDLIDRTENAAIRGQCVDKASRLLEEAGRASSLSDAEKQSITLQRIDLAEQSGDLQNALDLIAGILKSSPAAIDLQIRAAEVIGRSAEESGKEELFAKAISGESSQSIWGWAKLTSTLVRMHIDEDDKSKYFDRMMKCAYQLNVHRVARAERTPSAETKRKLVSDTTKHIRQLKTTLASNAPDWLDKLDVLQERVNRLSN